MLLHDRYELGALLGSGGAGAVFAARDVLRCDQVALKRISVVTERDRDEVRREYVALHLARLTGVVRVRDLFDGPWDVAGAATSAIEPTLADLGDVEAPGPGLRAMWLVMERVEGQPFGVGPWARIEAPARQLMRTLAALHRRRLVHGDIKHANVIVSGGAATLVDLGLSRREGAAGRFGFTLRYAAPEVRRGGRASIRGDLYALGATLYASLRAGCLPTAGVPEEALLDPELRDPPIPPLPPEVHR
ncbi:MAG TPA: protein kinase [Myxococcota bacterium]|nr:protein kinase [Myxococcota bacterium]